MKIFHKMAEARRVSFTTAWLLLFLRSKIKGWVRAKPAGSHQRGTASPVPRISFFFQLLRFFPALGVFTTAVRLCQIEG